MKIKYGELPPLGVCQKLVSVSFNSPRKNLAVYKFCKQISGYLEYIENERIKLFQKYGEEDANNPELYVIKKDSFGLERFNKEWGELTEMEIEDEINPLPLSEEDFLDDNCTYSLAKSMWLNAQDIGTILKFCD